MCSSVANFQRWCVLCGQLSTLMCFPWSTVNSDVFFVVNLQHWCVLRGQLGVGCQPTSCNYGKGYWETRCILFSCVWSGKGDLRETWCMHEFKSHWFLFWFTRLKYVLLVVFLKGKKGALSSIVSLSRDQVAWNVPKVFSAHKTNTRSMNHTYESNLTALNPGLPATHVLEDIQKTKHAYSSDLGAFCIEFSIPHFTRKRD